MLQKHRYYVDGQGEELLLRGLLDGRRVWLAAGLFVFALPSLVGLKNFNQVVGHSRAFGPAASLRISRPVLQWEVWGGDGNTVTAYKMQLNGQDVPCTYDSQSKKVWYQPEQPLPAGRYDVTCQASVDDILPMKANWQFQVGDAAESQLPTPLDAQLSALDELNVLRKRENLPSAKEDISLCAAAQAHADYMAAEKCVSHVQNSTSTHFLAASQAERLAAFGFVGGAYESVGFEHERTPNQVVSDLFDAPYHRIGFLQPGEIVAGTGVVDRRVDLEFGVGDQTGIVVSPANGETNVPTIWAGLEEPNPLRFYDHTEKSGYPIVIASFGDKKQRIADGTATLIDFNGNKVNCYVNSPVNDDHLKDTIFVIPTKKLSPGTYEVDADLLLANQEHRTIKSQFTVGS